MIKLAENRSNGKLAVPLDRAAKMPFPVHPHMLRHACGFKLANDGQDNRCPLDVVLGQSGRFRRVRVMSGYPSIATGWRTFREVRFVPTRK